MENVVEIVDSLKNIVEGMQRLMLISNLFCCTIALLNEALK